MYIYIYIYICDFWKSRTGALTLIRHRTTP